MGTRKQAIFADCPECAAFVRFTKMPKMRYMVVCKECDTKLEVIDIDPLELDWAIDMDEDDDDDEDVFGDYDPDLDDDWDNDDDDDGYTKPSKKSSKPSPKRR